MTTLLRRSDAVFAFVLLAAFAIMVGEASRYPRDSRLFPMLIGGIGLVVAALLLWRMARGLVPQRADDEEGSSEVGDAAPLWAALLAAPAFGLVMHYLGFWAATALCAFFGPAVMGYRSFWRRLVLAICTVATLVLLFPVILNVPLPRGELVDYMFQVPDDED